MMEVVKLKHMIHKNAVCPHYRHEDSQVIYCDGVNDNSVIHVAFASKSESLAYKMSMCRENFGKCRVYRMLSDMYDDQKGKNEIRKQKG